MSDYKTHVYSSANIANQTVFDFSKLENKTYFEMSDSSTLTISGASYRVNKITKTNSDVAVTYNGISSIIIPLSMSSYNAKYCYLPITLNIQTKNLPPALKTGLLRPASPGVTDIGREEEYYADGYISYLHSSNVSATTVNATTVNASAVAATS